jgi:membrane-associated protease RseP (regulator of RpoE activity)
MKYFIYCLALCTPMVALAQVQKDVRIEKRVFVIKDGKMLEQPNDSILKELKINIDTLVEGKPLSGAFGGAGDGNIMIFRGLNSGPAMLGVRVGQTDGVEGVVVQSVEPVSTAAALGLAIGDVIYRVNGQKITDPASLVSLIRGLEQGARVDLNYRRDGAKKRVQGYLIPVSGGPSLPQWPGEEPIRIELAKPREF